MSGFNFGAKPAAGGTGSFSFGTPATTASTAGSSGFNFGATPSSGFAASVAPTTQATTGGFSLGGGSTGTTGGFSLGATTTAAPASGGFGFGTATVSKDSAPSTGGFSFGGAKPSTTPTATPGGGLTLGAPAASTGGALKFGSTSGGGLTLGQTTTAGGGLTLGGKPTATATPSLTLGAGAPTSSATGGFKLGGDTGSNLSSLLKATTAATATTVAQPTPAAVLGAGKAATTTTTSGITLGGGLKLGTTAAATTASAPGFSLGGGLKLGGTTTTVAAVAPTSVTTSTAASTGVTLPGATAASQVPQMNYRQLEEAINKWTIELEDQEKIFLQQATQVNAWDRLLIENGEKITSLNSDVERVKIDQQRLDHELDFILAQQKELEEMLAPLEKTMEQLPPITYQQHADLEREHTYQLAENIDAQLKRMAQDLKEIIEHLNASNSSQDANQPVNQIAKILNAHMDSLQWIDQSTAVLQRRVDEVGKQTEQMRRDQERNFRLAYN